MGALERPNRAIVNIGVPVASLATDSGTGVFSIVNTTGGFNLTSPYINGILGGGTLTVKNLRVDLVNKQVLADLAGRPLISQDDPTLVYGDEVVFSGALWDIGAIAGPTSLPPVDLLAAIGGDASALAARGYVLRGSRDLVLNGRTNKVYDVTATTVLSKLTVTEQGFEAFAHALGDVVGTTGYVTLANVNNGAAGWGSLKLDMKASFMEEPQLSYPPITEVPESETYVLMGIGLLGLAGAVRRQRVLGVTRTPE